jgi:hypothetical protein
VTQLKGLELESAWIFSALLAVLVGAATFAGYFYDQIIMGSFALNYLGNSIQSFLPFVTQLKGLELESAYSFAVILAVLIGAAALAGWFSKTIVEGSFALGVLGSSLAQFAPILNTIKSLSIEDAEKIRQMMYALIDGAIYAGKHIGDVLLGAGAFMILTEALKGLNVELKLFAESMGKMSGLTEPLLKLADSLYSLGMSIRSFGSDLGSLSEVEMQRMIQLSGSVSQSSGDISSDKGGIMEEIKNILLETKEIHTQALQGGNAVIMQNNSRVSNNNTSESTIHKSYVPSDRYFTRLNFKNHL